MSDKYFETFKGWIHEKAGEYWDGDECSFGPIYDAQLFRTEAFVKKSPYWQEGDNAIPVEMRDLS